MCYSGLHIPQKLKSECVFFSCLVGAFDCWLSLDFFAVQNVVEELRLSRLDEFTIFDIREAGILREDLKYFFYLVVPGMGESRE